MININTGLSETNFEKRTNTQGILKIKKNQVIFELIDTKNHQIQTSKDELLITENEVNAQIDPSNLWLSCMKVIVNVINDNKDKHLDSISISSIENTFIVWSSQSSEALTDELCGWDARNQEVFDEFMNFIMDNKKINGVDWIHQKTGKWISSQNALTKILFMIINNKDIRMLFFHYNKKKYVKFGQADSFVVNKFTGKQQLSTIKAHEMCLLNKDLQYDPEILELMNKQLFSKLKDKLKDQIMLANDIDDKIDPEAAAEIDINRFKLITLDNFPKLVPCVQDQGVIDFNRNSKDSAMVQFLKKKQEYLQKQKDKKNDKSSQQIIDDNKEVEDEQVLQDLESQEFTQDRDTSEFVEPISNFMFTATRAIHETFNEQQYKGAGEALEIIFNQKLSDQVVHISYISSNLITSLVGCAMLNEGSTQVETDEDIQIVTSTWKNQVTVDAGLETVPLLHIYGQDFHIKESVSAFLLETFSNIGAETNPLDKQNKPEDEDLILWGLKGKLSTCGNMIKYLKLNLKALRTEIKIDELLVQDYDNQQNFLQQESPRHLHFVPAFQGLDYPRCLQSASSMLVGLDSTHSDVDIIKACVEGVALTIYDQYIELAKLVPVEHIQFGGRQSQCRTIQEILSNLLQANVYKHKSLPILFNESENKKDQQLSDVCTFGAKFCLEVSQRQIDFEIQSESLNKGDDKRDQLDKQFQRIDQIDEWKQKGKLMKQAWSSARKLCDSEQNVKRVVNEFKNMNFMVEDITI